MLITLPIRVIWANDNMEEFLWAVTSGDLAKVKSLVEQGVNVNAESSEFGGFALAVALVSEHYEVAKYLVSKGADVNARFKKYDNATILMLASSARNLEIVQYLIAKGADINAKDDNGKTALMEATLNGNIEVVKYLISKGAYINAISTNDSYSMTALDLAEVAENYDIAEFLRKAGAKSLLNGTQFAVVRKDFKDSRVDAQIATIRSDIASTLKAIVARVFADNIYTIAPKAPNPNNPAIKMQWGAWIAEIAGLDTNRWEISSNGIYPKDCPSETPLIWINIKTGIMHFNPSKINGDSDFCRNLRNSYRSSESNGDRTIPLSTIE